MLRVFRTVALSEEDVARLFRHCRNKQRKKTFLDSEVVIDPDSTAKHVRAGRVLLPF